MGLKNRTFFISIFKIVRVGRVTSTTSSSAICSTAELKLQIASNGSVLSSVSIAVVFAGG
jgi:hypothetical protein